VTALALWGCEVVPELLAEERRPLGEVAVAEHRYAVSGTLRGWRYPTGDAGDGFAFAHERWYVGWEVADARGDADHSWLLADADAARALANRLALESCAAADRAAFRLSGADAPWRLLVPDGPAAGIGLVEADLATCAEALAWAPSGEAYLQDRADSLDLCAHLAHRGRRQDALRCLLRQDPGTVPRVAARQDLPNAANDAGFDEDLVAVLVDPRPRPFAPYRVAGLLPELDAVQLATVDAAIRSRPRPLEGWEAARVGAPMPDAPPQWRPPGVPADLPCAFAVRGAPDVCPR
jgi:hypothetical protein